MGRHKVRNYNTRDFYRKLFDGYFTEHNEEVMKEVLEQTGFKTVEDLSRAEYHGYFGLDCGWIQISPTNREQAHEWYLDSNRIDTYLFIHNPCYNTQSTTIKEIMTRRALKDLGLENEFSMSVRLD